MAVSGGGGFDTKIPARTQIIETGRFRASLHTIYIYLCMSTTYHILAAPHSSHQHPCSKLPCTCMALSRPYNSPMLKLPSLQVKCRHRNIVGCSNLISKLRILGKTTTHVFPPPGTSTIFLSYPYFHNHNPHHGAQARMDGHPPRLCWKAG